MGTRGAYGFTYTDPKTKETIIKVQYCHFDTYPSGLGKDFIEAVYETLWNEEVVNRIKNIKLLEDTEDNYFKLRDYQGDVKALLKGDIDEMIDNKEFLYDSLFCEYAYIFNLDCNVLEFYIGFNKDPNADGVYASKQTKSNKETGNGYFGVRLKNIYDLDFLVNSTPTNESINKDTYKLHQEEETNRETIQKIIEDMNNEDE